MLAAPSRLLGRRCVVRGAFNRGGRQAACAGSQSHQEDGSGVVDRWVSHIREKKYGFIPGSEFEKILVHFGATKDGVDADKMKNVFEGLPPNPAMDYKFAAEACILARSGKDTMEVEKLPVMPFILYESDMVHPDGIQGKPRKYEELPDKWAKGPFMKAYAKFSRALMDFEKDREVCNAEWDDQSTDVVIKQWPNRVVRRAADGVGESSPEGVHQDGCEVGMITFVDRANVERATNRVWSLKQPLGKYDEKTTNDNLIAEMELTNYLDTFVFMDRSVKHEATPFQPVRKDKDATRDVIVTMARRPMKNGYDWGQSRRAFSTSPRTPSSSSSSSARKVATGTVATTSQEGRKKVAVVGMGPSGMALLNAFSRDAALQGAGPDGSVSQQVDLVFYDRQQAWGGMWNYDWRTGVDEEGQPIHASMYRQLWSNSPKETNEFFDYTYLEHFNGKSTPSYLPRSLMRDYIAGRAEHALAKTREVLLNDDSSSNGLRVSANINYGCTVKSVSYSDAQQQFVVAAECKRPGSELPECHQETFDHVIVATGHFSVPYSAKFPGVEKFNGRLMHSTDLRDAHEFAGKNVVVVGNGNSGEDVALQCYKYGAAEVRLAYRTEPRAFAWPEGIQEVPNLVEIINGIHKSSCKFADGSIMEDVDAIILCTGYVHHLPYLEDDLKLRTQNCLYPERLYKGVAWQNNPKLFYMGMQDIWIGLKVYDLQAYFIRDAILGRVNDYMKDSAMAADIKRWRDKLALAESSDDRLHFQKEYLQDLDEATSGAYHAQCAELMEQHVADYLVCVQHKEENPVTYRDKVFKSRLTNVEATQPPEEWLTADENVSESLILNSLLKDQEASESSSKPLRSASMSSTSL
eukprot:TRINITY_DN16163_c0_g1_i1.p1 TRINITY_DN16163_c0_g1~~TRINITY_DN16163_c0_g1_i1.p1  ORF type:complete len:862 (-),score=163.81 TRINITY_DN16163_c0_g1_i1:401-2986(-)